MLLLLFQDKCLENDIRWMTKAERKEDIMQIHYRVTALEYAGGHHREHLLLPDLAAVSL